MDVQLILNALVRQTTVLIAQVATTAGARAPLAHIANQVFLDLVGELERQGVGRKVVADMFGLALRSYQQKVQRLSESATDSGVTLWEAVHAFLSEQRVVSRGAVLTRFCRDNEASVRSILKDLVETGLVYQTGRGDASLYRVASEEDLAQLHNGDTSEHLARVAWLTIYRNSPATRAELGKLIATPAEALDHALANLLEDGRISKEANTGEARYTSQSCLIPLEDAAGWEAALIDHYQAVVAAICTKLRNGKTRALPDDRVGGSTYSFDIWPGHPVEERAHRTLSELRTSLGKLWDECVEYNRTHVRPEHISSRVTVYCGQFETTNT